jgi:ribosomal protein S18 acetylase RimI-like enzyme
MQLYRAYLKERENAELIERSWGWCSYRVEADHVYLIDIYVLPQYRQHGKGTELLAAVENVARECGRPAVLGSIATNVQGADKMYNIMHGLGFKIHSSDKDIIYMIKEIK